MADISMCDNVLYNNSINNIFRFLPICIVELVKVGGGLSASIPVQRGIRQGCPLSGQLYFIAIEPLLRRMRRHLKGFSIPNDCNCNRIVLSAYADDITVFLNGQEDVNNLTKA